MEQEELVEDRRQQQCAAVGGVVSVGAMMTVLARCPDWPMLPSIVAGAAFGSAVALSLSALGQRAAV
ncbi:MAG: hypothetical protein JWQ48_4068 [Conexibacter sp.]|nr:hypothetical protein [Conexibacter sp.]